MQSAGSRAGGGEHPTGSDGSTGCCPGDGGAVGASAGHGGDAGCGLRCGDGGGRCDYGDLSDGGRSGRDRDRRRTGDVGVSGLGGVGDAATGSRAGWGEDSASRDCTSGCCPSYGGAVGASAGHGGDAGCGLRGGNRGGRCDNGDLSDRGRRGGDGDRRRTGDVGVSGLGGVGDAATGSRAGWGEDSASGDRTSGCCPGYGGAVGSSAGHSGDAGCGLRGGDGGGRCDNIDIGNSWRRSGDRNRRRTGNVRISRLGGVGDAAAGSRAGGGEDSAGGNGSTGC